MDVVTSRIDGSFTGYNGGAVFPLINGQVWQQRRYRYRYKYKYRPAVRIFEEGRRYYMKVDCMGDSIEVVRVTVIERGIIVSKFEGFNGSSRFEFQNGRIWKQAEYKYSYHYAYRPEAIVVEGISGIEIHVDGMSEGVRVQHG